jgi:ribosomal protein S18 acetylase RimI-like enzyme
MKTGLSDVTIRGVEQSDYERVLSIIDDWWDGRIMSARLSRVFFEHFCPTSFVAEAGGELVGFLLGFVSQTYPGEAHVHFIGVRPDHRRAELGMTLYERFFGAAYAQYCSVVRASTSPANKGSIAFHRALGFLVEPGDGEIDGVPVRQDYPVPGESRVQFVRYVCERHGVAPPGARDLLAS